MSRPLRGVGGGGYQATKQIFFIFYCSFPNWIRQRLIRQWMNAIDQGWAQLFLNMERGIPLCSLRARVRGLLYIFLVKSAIIWSTDLYRKAFEYIYIRKNFLTFITLRENYKLTLRYLVYHLSLKSVASNDVSPITIYLSSIHKCANYTGKPSNTVTMKPINQGRVQ